MRLFAGIDIETTGLLTPDHRIIEVYIGLWTDAGRLAFEWTQRIDPERSIDKEAQRTHKIAATDLMGQPKWGPVAPNIVKILSKASDYVWHNGEDFDGPFLSQELKRVGLELPKRPGIDTMKQGLWATPDGKRPNLGELCFACGVPYDPTAAHAADYDVKVMMDCFFKARAWGLYQDTPTETTLAA